MIRVGYKGLRALGYSDGDDATVILSMRWGYMTVHIRKTFNISDPSKYNRYIV